MVASSRKGFISLMVFVGIILLVNVIASFLYTRIDFTKEGRYTLSKNTKNILSRVKEDLQITVYLEGDFPAGFKKLRNSTKDILTDYKSYSNRKIQFNFVNPSTGDQENQDRVYQELISKGIEPTNLSVKTEDGVAQKIIFPAALITYKGKQFPVKLLQNRTGATPEEVLNSSIENLEYAFTSAISKALSGEKIRVGFTEGHGELSDLQLNDAMKSLQDGYEVGRVNLKTIPFTGLDKLNLLIIAKPSTQFSEAEKYKIDYFVTKGGSVFWAIDNVNAELDSLRGASNQLSFPKKLNLDDMLFKYGVRINYNLIADMNCAQIPITVGNIGGQPQIQLLPWLFYPVFIPRNEHPIIRNIDGIRSEFASTIDVISVKNIHTQVLLTTSPFNRILDAPTMLSLQMVEQEPNPKDFQSPPKIVSVLLEGRFSSVFANRPMPESITDKVTIPLKGENAKMVVFGDGDILKNQISATDGSAFPLGYDRYSRQQYGNKNFLLNCVDYLTDDSGLISLRNKEIKLRLLDRARIRTEKLTWQLINIVLPLLLVGLLAIFQHLYRKRKYAV